MADLDIPARSNDRPSSPLEKGQSYCPLSDQLCPRGSAQATRCCEIFATRFDPVSNMSHFAMLACASQAAGVSPP